ncbi:MAG: hypothetical protein JSV25_16585 [Spirochaetota bacterium]|nr:MAG: hypothetical protein JSV25_16585 [Spirochaetota bacterium]
MTSNIEKDIEEQIEKAPLVINTKLVVKQLILSLAILSEQKDRDFEKTVTTITEIGKNLHEQCMAHLREALTALSRLIKTEYLGGTWIDGVDLVE